MKWNKKYTIVPLVGIILIIASIPIVFFVIYNTSGQKNLQIEFTPKEMKSYSNHSAWLLLDIRTNSNELMSNLSISIKTNISIELEYKIWENEPLRKIVEVFLYPNVTHLNNIIEIEAVASSGRISKKDYAKVQVLNWTSNISPTIELMRDVFVNYLSSNHSNFKINESTVWEGFGNAPFILVVEHYLFKSAFWEMELARHVMIAPHDWVKIYLRPRFSLFPNWSGTINSWSSGNHTIIETEPPNDIYR